MTKSVASVDVADVPDNQAPEIQQTSPNFPTDFA